jgi:hypothetical protein
MTPLTILQANQGPLPGGHMRQFPFLIPACAAATVALLLSGCDKPQPTGPDAPPTVDGTTAPAGGEPVASTDDLATREIELERREQALALREREAELARREAELDQRVAAPSAKPAPPVTATRPAPVKPAPQPVAVRPSGAASAPAARAVTRLQVPAGTRLALTLSQPLSTKTARAGEPFEATLAAPVTVDGRVALPGGTRVTGTVTDVVSGSNKIGGVPTLGLRFDGLELADGQKIAITGDLVEQGRSDTGRDTAKILGGAAAGAILGHQVKRGDSGKVIGGLLGGAIGAVAAQKTGAEVMLDAGAPLSIDLGAPVEVVVR